MIFFLDENFPRPALIELRVAGHSASHALDVFEAGTNDDKLFAYAQRQEAILSPRTRTFSTQSRLLLQNTTAQSSSRCARQTGLIYYAGSTMPWPYSARKGFPTQFGW